MCRARESLARSTASLAVAPLCAVCSAWDSSSWWRCTCPGPRASLPTIFLLEELDDAFDAGARDRLRQAQALSLRGQLLHQLACAQPKGPPPLQLGINRRLDDALALGMPAQHAGEGREHARIEGIGLGLRAAGELQRLAADVDTDEHRVGDILSLSFSPARTSSSYHRSSRRGGRPASAAPSCGAGQTSQRPLWLPEPVRAVKIQGRRAGIGLEPGICGPSASTRRCFI